MSAPAQDTAAAWRTHLLDNHSPRLTQWVYDDFNRETESHLPNHRDGGTISAAVSKSNYDREGRRWLSIDADGKATAYVHDALGRLRWVVTDVKNTLIALPPGLPSTWAAADKNPDSTITGYEYDELGQLAKQTDGRSYVTEFSYDKLGRRVTRKLPNLKVESIEHDYPVGPLVPGVKQNNVRRSDFEGRYSIVKHDVMGQVISREAAGQAAGVPALSAAGVQPVSFTYTATGQRKTMTDASGTSRYAYDELGQLRVKQTPQGTLYYEHEPWGAVKLISARNGYTFGSNPSLPDYSRFNSGAMSANSRPAGAQVVYGHDDRTRLQTVREVTGGSAMATYGYHGGGELRTVAYGNGLTTTYDYNSRQQLRRSRTVNATALLANFDYDDAGSGATPTVAGGVWGPGALLSPAGVRRRQIENIGGTVRNFDYLYDGLNRLQRETHTQASSYLLYDSSAGYSDTWGYDPVGNRRGRTVFGTSYSGATGQTLRYDKNDQLDNDTNPETISSYFDANGNTRSYGGGTYDYDFENRLIRAVKGSAEVILVYDGDGNRASKTVGPTSTFYLVDDRNPTGYAQVLEEQPSAGGTPGATYIYGLDLVSQKRGGVTRYFGYDGLGTVRYLTGGDGTDSATFGTVTDTYRFDAFGVMVARQAKSTTGAALVDYVSPNWETAPAGTQPAANHYRFAGEQWDADLGMYYLRARYYHPDLGRFWTMDTFEGIQNDPLSLHKYLYAHANPVNMFDPSGQFSLSSTLTTAGNIGILAGKTSFAFWQGYNRAAATYGAIQDVALVAGMVGDGELDDEESDILMGLLDDYVKARLQGYALRIAAGAGGRALGAAAGTASTLRITQAGVQRTREWYKTHRAKWAGKTSGNPNYSVQYDKDGWPNFSPYLYQGGVNRVRIRLTGSRKADFDAADAEAGISEGWRKANGYTWHHSQKLGTMELVKSAAHNPGLGGAPHAGGSALWEQLYGQKYGP